jgi:hypothetical protein
MHAEYFRPKSDGDIGDLLSLDFRQDRTHVDCKPGAYTGASKKVNSGGVASFPTALVMPEWPRQGPTILPLCLPDQPQLQVGGLSTRGARLPGAVLFI